MRTPAAVLVAALLAAALVFSASLLHAAPPEYAKLLGPALGHVGETQAAVWARAEKPGTYTLYVFDSAGTRVSATAMAAVADHDLCMTWRLTDLKPGTLYGYFIRAGDPVTTGPDAPKFEDRGILPLRTRVPTGQPQKVSLVVGSCMNDPVDQPQPIWSMIRAERPDALVFVGDTPYIDSTKLEVQRTKRRAFMGNTDLLALRRVTPTYYMWDDHDFGANDTDGNIDGKDQSRKAALEWSANAENPQAPTNGGPGFDGAGENNLGLYNTFTLGSMQVFLLDARWFAGTEQAESDPTRKTLLGKQQWAWLRRELKKSTATFKLLTTGMVWNDSVRDNKTDYWGYYPHERAQMIKLISEEKISGVILVGGDIHRSRAFKHASDWPGLPYPLYEIVSSPFGQNPHVNPNKPDSSLLFDNGSGRAFVSIEADSTVTPPVLTARWIDALGVNFYTLKINAGELMPSK